MHDLRKKILLESGKTVSRKAQLRPEPNGTLSRQTPKGSPNSSQPTSRVNSRPTSRANSAPSSRYASEDEENDFSDLEDDIRSREGPDGPGGYDDDTARDGTSNDDDWPLRLRSRISELQDRKRSSVQGRETVLKSYLYLVRHHFADKEVSCSIVDILPPLLKSTQSGGSTLEKTLAINALTVTILTASHTDFIFEDILKALKKAALNEEQEAIKAAAIRAQAVLVMYSGAMVSLSEEMMDYLIEIVETDGKHLGALDSGLVVTTAIKTWVVIASQLANIEDEADRAMEAFVEQLDSTDAEVQTAAGAAIAFLFEVARGGDADDDGDNANPAQQLNLRYDAHTMARRMAELGRHFSRSVPRSDRRRLKSRFASIVSSLEHGKGPGWREVWSGQSSNPHTGGRKPAAAEDSDSGDGRYQFKIRLRNSVAPIDTWSKLSRIDFLRTALQGGFATHLEDSPTVHAILSDVDMRPL